MGILTWQNVPVGDLSAAQDGYRTASALFDRAARGGSEITAQAQAIEATQKAADQSAADKVLAAKMISFQDPAAYKAALSNGTLADPAIMQGASIGALLKVDAQQAALQDRAKSDQELKNSQQQYDRVDYVMSRMKEGDKLSDAAMPVLNQALKVAVHDRQKALGMIQNSGMFLEDQVKAVKMLDEQFQDTSSQRRLALEERNFQLLDSASRLKEELKNKYNGDMGAMAGALKDYASNPKNKHGAIITSMVRSDLRREDPAFAKEVDSVKATFGVDQNDLGSDPYRQQVNEYSNTVVDMNRRMSQGAKILAEANALGLNGASADTIAQSIAKTHAGFKPEEFAAMVRKKTKEAQGQGKDVSEAEVAQVLVNSTQDAGMLNANNFKDGVDLIEGDADKLMAMIGKNRTELELYNKVKQLSDVFTREAESARNNTLAVRIAEKASDKGIGMEGDAGKNARERVSHSLRSMESVRTQIEELAVQEKKKKDAGEALKEERRKAEIEARKAREEWEFKHPRRMHGR